VVIVLSVLPRFTISDYPFGVLWPLYCLSLLDLRLLITPLVSCGHCIVCHSSILYCLWFLDFVLSVIPRFTTSKGIIGSRKSRKDRQYNGHKIPKGSPEVVNRGRTDNTTATRYQRGNQKSGIVCPSSIYDFWLPLWYLKATVLSVLHQFTTSDYLFGIMWPLYCLSFFVLRFLITPLVSCGLYIIFPSSWP
jgi:hypothetical protein